MVFTIKPSEIESKQLWERYDGRVGMIEINHDSRQFIWKLIFEDGTYSTHDAYGKYGVAQDHWNCHSKDLKERRL